MKTQLFFFGIIFLTLIACKKEDDRTLLDATFFELDACFSSNSLVNQDIIITDQDSYKTFESDIKRHFFTSCESEHLPAIDFDSYFFAGVYTSITACEVTYSRKLYYNTTTNKYDYEISANASGTCENEMLITSFNCAIVPIKSDTAIVNFIISNQ